MDKEISYQNKDIVSKILTEEFRGKSFSVYGLNLPKIKDIRPTNLPAVQANELRLDNLFLLEDESYALIDYESQYKEEKKCEYLNYVARITKRLYNELGKFIPIKIIIIYTSDVKRGETNPILDLKGVRLELTEAFLIELDSDSLFKNAENKIRVGKELDNEELMGLIVYPLTFKGKHAKQKALRQAIELAKCVQNSRTSVFILKMLWSFSDKFTTKEDAEIIKEAIHMTKVDMLYAEEKRKAIEENTKEVTERVTADVTKRVTADVTKKVTDDVTKKVTKKVTDDVTKEVTKKVTDDVTKKVIANVSEKIASNFIRFGLTPESVAENTGLPIEQVLEIKARLVS